MRWWKRALIAISILIALVILIIFAAGYLFLLRPFPVTNGTIKVSGLKASVEVYRDRWGVPHIYAQNLEDLFFAQGYVTAQDRLWQMEFSRRIGSGPSPKYWGRSP